MSLCMSNTSSDNLRIAKNTLLLYVRMFLLILVQLYTVPIVLRMLGVEDYGIYNVVGGVVTLFSFVGSSLASGAQRFMAFEIGVGNKEKLKKVFDTTVSIYILLAVIIVVLLEIVGYWFLNTQMNIPEDRMYAANWVFQFSVLTFLMNLISIPYNAAIIAHERMSFFAYISILECLLRLVVVLVLQYILYDKLIIYALLACFVSFIIWIIYQIYCRKNFEECRHFKFGRQTYMGKELLVYSGWNMIGSVALISRQQGLNIVVNLFFGPVLNAAHSIAQQINGILTQFINNVYVATRPRITKLYASNKTEEMWSLVFHSSKLAFYLLMLISIPALIEIDVVLNLWLHDVPSYTSTITRLMIGSILVETLVNQVIGVYQAENKIKMYQMYSSVIILLTVPISYIGLKIYPEIPMLPYWVFVILSIVYVYSILRNAVNDISLDVKAFLRDVLLIDIVVYIFSIGSVWVCVFMIPASLMRVFLTIFLTIIYSLIFIWIIGLNQKEKQIVKRIVQQKILRK